MTFWDWAYLPGCFVIALVVAEITRPYRKAWVAKLDRKEYDKLLTIYEEAWSDCNQRYDLPGRQYWEEKILEHQRLHRGRPRPEPTVVP